MPESRGQSSKELDRSLTKETLKAAHNAALPQEMLREIVEFVPSDGLVRTCQQPHCYRAGELSRAVCCGHLICDPCLQNLFGMDDARVRGLVDCPGCCETLSRSGCTGTVTGTVTGSYSVGTGAQGNQMDITMAPSEPSVSSVQVENFAKESLRIVNSRVGSDQKQQKHARDYQLEAFCEIVQGNRIINIRTGMGKTQIASYAMDYFLDKYPGKIAVFCVRTTPLVEQQAVYFERNSRFPKESPEAGKEGSVMVYRVQAGAMIHLDVVREQLAQGQRIIVVIIHDIFYLALQSHPEFRDLLSIVIFDEVHHAIKQHTYAKILNECFDDLTPEQKPRFAGLTASFLHGHFTIPKIMESRRKLEVLLEGTMWLKKKLTSYKMFGHSARCEETVLCI